MTGFKKGTGSLDLSEDNSKNDADEQPTDDSQEATTNTNTTPTTPNTDIDVNELPYLVDRQMRGAAVNADRTKQLQLKVRPFVEKAESELIDDLDDRLSGPVNKGDVREAAMIVARENPELIADKLREWGVDVLEK